MTAKEIYWVKNPNGLWVKKILKDLRKGDIIAGGEAGLLFRITEIYAGVDGLPELNLQLLYNQPWEAHPEYIGE